MSINWVAIKDENVTVCDPDDASSPLKNRLDITGRVVLVKRGAPEFGVQALRAQNAGAIAIVIVQNTSVGAYMPDGDTAAMRVTIPVFMVKQDAGSRLMEQIKDAEVDRKNATSNFTQSIRALEKLDESDLTLPVRFHLYERRERQSSAVVTQAKTEFLYPKAKDTTDRVLAYCHVASVLLSERQYTEATDYLLRVDRALKSTRDTSPEEMMALRRIATFNEINSDNTPDAVAVRLCAHAIILRKLHNRLAEPFGSENHELLRKTWSEHPEFLPKLITDRTLLDEYFVNSHRITKETKLTRERFEMVFNAAAKAGHGPGWEEYWNQLSTNSSKRELWNAVGKTKMIKKHHLSDLPSASSGPRVEPDAFAIIKKMVKDFGAPQPLPNASGGTACDGIFDTSPKFVRAFPTELHPTYAMMQDSQDVRSTLCIGMQLQYGIADDPSDLDVGVGNKGLQQVSVQCLPLWWWCFRFLQGRLWQGEASRAGETERAEQLNCEVKIACYCTLLPLVSYV